MRWSSHPHTRIPDQTLNMDPSATPPTPQGLPPQTIEREVSTPRTVPTTPQLLLKIKLPKHTHGARIIHDDLILTDDNAVQQYIESRLRQMNAPETDEHAIQKIVFELISRARLTTAVFKKLRGFLL
jgi:hypothetical protein